MDIEEIFSENSYSSDINVNSFEEDEVIDRNKPWYDDLKTLATYSNPTTVPDTVYSEQMYAPADYGWAICNRYHTKVPCNIMLTEKYKLEFISFLKKKGEIVWRSLQQGSNDISYIFLYKNVFVVISYHNYNKHLSGIIVYHPINVLPPLQDFELYKLPTEIKAAQIGIIKQTKYGLRVDKIRLKNTQMFSEDNYNNDFSTFFDNIKTKLADNRAGLYLLHGEPGTGKSSAIRHLITQVDRDFVFVPPQMVNLLSTPEFADIITDTNRGSVLVIEDAEKALMKRETEDGFSNSTLVSSILNLTDGLYADLGNIAVIATYNCDRNLIDNALLRKGRMKAEYKFDKLSVERSQLLINKLGHGYTVTEPMSIADIFNYDDQYTNIDDDREKKPIGFNSRPGF